MNLFHIIECIFVYVIYFLSKLSEMAGREHNNKNQRLWQTVNLLKFSAKINNKDSLKQAAIVNQLSKIFSQSQLFKT